jgi:transposase-like protein
LYGLAKRHDICRNLIRVWVQKYEASVFDEDAAAADLLQQYEARIAALERLVGKQALELEFVKGAVRNPYDNLKAESFMKTVKVEAVYEAIADARISAL